MSNKEPNKKLTRQSIAMMVLLAVTIVSLCVTGWAVFLRPKPKLTDYAPAELEPNALNYEEDISTEKLSASSGGGAVSISYTKQVYVDTVAHTATLHYANPMSSVNYVAVQLVLVDDAGREAVLGQSGMLKPGTKLETLALTDDAGLKPGSYGGKFVLTFYDPDTGEKAIVNTVVEGLEVVVDA